MSLFGLNRLVDRYGVMVDVGSGSVLIAIVHSKPGVVYPTIVWSHREQAPLRDIDSLERSVKEIKTAIMNVAMLFDMEGRKALREYNRGAKLTELQCGVSAPWSYTVTKTVSYSHETPFTISQQLFEQLEDTAEKKVVSELNVGDILRKFNLTVVSQATTGMLVNGYKVEHPQGCEASELSLSRTTAVVQGGLLEQLHETQQKLIPKANMTCNSFILLLYTVLQEFMPALQNVCLVDVTYEATEIGVVRDGLLTYSTHMPFGTFSLAREISAITKLPLSESFAHLHVSPPYQFLQALPDKQRAEVEMVFDSYVKQLSELFKETGDELSIPRQLCIHTERETESLYTDLCEKAAKRVLKTKPTVVMATAELTKLAREAVGNDPKKFIPIDAALLVSAQFFHKHNKWEEFEYF